jgi:urease accessory protein
VELAAGAVATLREVVVLGRHGQCGGRYVGGLEVVVGGVPLLVHTTVLDGADAALRGPAGTAEARAVGTLVHAGGDVPASRSGETAGARWAWTPLEGPGAVLMAVGTPSAVAAVLDTETGIVSRTPVPDPAGPAALVGV